MNYKSYSRMILASAVLFSAAYGTEYTGILFSIPQNDPGVTIGTINITDVGTITDLNIRITYDETDANAVGLSYLSFSLLSPSGTSITIAVGNGEGGTLHGGAMYLTLFDDEASTPISSGTPPYLGSFQPQNALSAFDGESILGLWSIVIYNSRSYPGDVEWAILLETDASTPFDPPNYGTEYDGSNFSIPQNDPGVTIGTINILDSGTITDLNIRITYDETDANAVGLSYLSFSLLSPSATSITVAIGNGEGGSLYGGAMYLTLFDDEASTAISSGSPPYLGSFQPQNALSIFDGESISGQWSLVINNTRSYPGNISWSILASIEHSVPTAGLVAYYPFNGNANDESGNGNNGTEYGTTLTADRFGNSSSAYDFDGVDDYINIGNTAGNSVRAISLWFNPTATIDASLATSLSLIYRNTSDESGEYGIVFTNSPAVGQGRIHFSRRIGAQNYEVRSDNPVWNAGDWHHLVCLIDGSVGMRMYVDGEEQSDTDLSVAPTDNRTEITSIGRWGDYNDNYFTGAIDDVRIYNRALSTAEIDLLYRTGGWPPPAVPTNLTATPGDQQITLTWQANSEIDFLRYRLYGGTTTNPTTQIDSTLEGVNDTTKIITNLSNGTTYYYRITAVDSAGNESGYSNEVSQQPIGLVAYYPFNGNASDESANGNNGIVYGASTAANRFSQTASAYSFDGVDDYIAISTENNPLRNLSSITMSLWFWPQAGGPYGRLMSVGNNDWFDLGTKADSNLSWHHTNEKPWVVVGTFSFAEWTHAVIIANPTHITVYINGQQTYQDPGGWNHIVDGPMSFGSRYNGSEFSNSIIDDVRIYNRDLSPAEIDLLYHLGGWPPPAAPTNLVATPGDQQVTINWSANTEDDLDKYYIYRDTSSPASTLHDSIVGMPLSTNYTDAGLTNGQFYYYRITAVDDSGNESDYSNQVMAVPPHRYFWEIFSGSTVDNYQWLQISGAGTTTVEGGWLKLDYQTGTAPHIQNGTVLDLIRDEMFITIYIQSKYVAPDKNFGFWIGDTNSGSVTGFQGQFHEGTLSFAIVKRFQYDGLDGGIIPLTESNPKVWATTTEYDAKHIVKIAKEDSIYVFYIDDEEIGRDTDASTQPTSLHFALGRPWLETRQGEYGHVWLDDIIVEALDRVAPQQPQYLSAIPGNQKIILNWQANSEPDFLRYRIYGGTSANPTTKIDSTLDGINDTTKVITNLSNGTTYYYRITAVDSAGNESEFSSEVSSMPSPFTLITAGDVSNDGGHSTGAFWGDYNNDGYVDLYISNEGENSFLYENNGDESFTKITTGPVVTDGGASAGTWGDYDNDGYLDLFVARRDGITSILYRNNRDGTFTAITTDPVVTDEGWSRVGSWGDYDNDGHLDLFVANYIGENNFLYHNDGDGSFTRVITGPVVSDGGNTESGTWGDYDNDGDLDLFAANRANTNNFLYTNNGDGSFSKVTSGVVVNDGAWSRAGSWGDYNNDGCLDLFVVNSSSQNNALYLNNGDGSFTKITSGSPVSSGGQSESGSWGDYNNDGYLDLFVANDTGESNFLYLNNGDGTFTDDGSSISSAGSSRGAAWADYNNDGYLDLIVANRSGENNFLYKNNGNINHWIRISLVGVGCNSAAIGAKIRLKAIIDGYPIWQVREISGQTGKNSQNSLFAHFGLGNSVQIDSIKVEWPSGIEQVLTNVLADQFLTIKEPDIIPPAAPTDLASLSSDQQISITWSANTENDLAEYRVYRDTSSPATTLIDSVVGLPPDTSYTDTGLSNGIAYYYRITAVDTAGNESGYSDESTGVPIGLVAYYPFNGNANDESGNGNDGTRYGATATTDRFGIVDGALSFDGINDYIVLPTGLLDNHEQLSYFTWLRKDIDGTMDILCGGHNGISWIALGLNTNGRLGAQLNLETSTFSTYALSGANLVNSQVWTHAGVSYNGSVVHIYLNGIVIDSVSSISGSTDIEGPVAIAKRALTGEAYFNGDIDEFRIYNRALTAVEIDSLYHLGGWPPPNAPTNLIAVPSNEQVVLNWSPNTEDDVAKYRIYRATSSPAATLIDSIMGMPLDTIYVDVGLANMQTYFYRITAVDTGGNASDFSSEVSATPLDLVAYYPFYGNADDESGWGHNGTLNGAVSATKDRFGNAASAYLFDGADDYVDLGSPPLLFLEETLTISTWLKTTTEGTILSARGADFNNQYLLAVYASGEPFFDRYPPNDGQAFSTKSVTDDQWHHMTVAMDDLIDSVYLYIDGRKESISYSETYTGGDPSCISIGAMMINDVATELFDGILDDIRIYNRVLDHNEVMALYVEGPPLAPVNLSAETDILVVSLAWDAVPQRDVNYYKIYRDTTPNALIAIDSVYHPDTMYVDLVDQPITYYYRITAVDSTGQESGFSVEIAAVALPDTIPPMVSLDYPVGGESIPEDTLVTLRWSVEDNIGLRKHDLFYSVHGDMDFVWIDSVGAEQDSLEWWIPRIVTDSAYIMVTSHDVWNNTAADINDVPFVIRDNTPPQVSWYPMLDTVLFASDTLRLTWSHNDNVGVIGCTFEYRVDPLGTWTSIASDLTDTTYLWILPPEPVDTLVVRLIGYDAVGLSDTALSASFRLISPYPVLREVSNTSEALFWRQDELTLSFSLSLDPSTIDTGSVLVKSAHVDQVAYTPVYHTQGNTVRVVFDSPLVSMDSLSITLLADSITSDRGAVYLLDGDGDFSPDGSGEDDIVLTYTVYPYSDFDSSGCIGPGDVSLFVAGWYADDYDFELGPSTGTKPYLQLAPDEQFNVRDIVTFIRMWNDQPCPAMMKIQKNAPVPVPQIAFDGGLFNLDLSSVEDLGSVFLQLSYPPTMGDGLIACIDSGGYVIHLKREWPEEGIIEFTMAMPASEQSRDALQVRTGISGRETVQVEVYFEISDREGHLVVWGETQMEVKPIPREYALHQNYPNPFNPSTTIRYELPEPSTVLLAVYDLLGKEVIRLVDGSMDAGYHGAVWNGRDQLGREVSSGIYLVNLSAPTYTKTRKLVLLK